MQMDVPRREKPKPRQRQTLSGLEGVACPPAASEVGSFVAKFGTHFLLESMLALTAASPHLGAQSRPETAIAAVALDSSCGSWQSKKDCPHVPVVRGITANALYVGVTLSEPHPISFAARHHAIAP